ncbi:MAG: class I SAM-dependent methyltransferase [Chlamydiota bacterium]
MIGLFFKVKWFLFREAREVKKHYPFFAPWNKAFNRAYRFANPYRICRNYLKKKGASDIHQYGETPLPVYARIAEECALAPEDYWIELGCGRGKGSCFIRALTGCRVKAVDWIPQFICIAQGIAEKDAHSKMTFSCEDMLQTDLSGATAIYLFGTCLEESVIQHLCERLRRLPPSTEIITVSYPLNDYDPTFVVRKQFLVQFPWGTTEIYIQRQLPHQSIPFTSA